MNARPRINWFSPLPPTRSEIARQTLTLLPELSARAEVIVWSNDSIYDEAAAAHATIKRYDPAHPPWREINRAEVTFYQMGNDPHYHEDIWRVSRQHPGVVILHDLKLQHFFAGLLTETKTLTRREYLELVEVHHSTAGVDLAESFLDAQIGIEALAEECPLMGAVVDGSLATIVHSEAARELISRSASVPTAYLRLPAGGPGPPDESFLGKRNWDGGLYRLVLFGFLGPNRRLPAILKALSLFPKRDRFHLDIYGTMDGAEQIVQLACCFGLQELVTWHGFVSDAELEFALQRSHLALNLRHPTMGEASGSQLHAWQYALPSLVSPTGWYSALPHDTVGFVRPEHETEDIQAHLAGLLEAPERYRAMGLKARQFVGEHCTTGAYADGIMELVARLPEFQAIRIAHNLADRAGSSMSAWAEPDGLSGGAAHAIHALVSGYFRPPHARP